MTLDMGNTDKLNGYRRDLEKIGVELLPPDVTRSTAEFTVELTAEGKKAIRYALAAIKGVGREAMARLVAEREENGPFKDLFDFAERLDQRVLNKRLVESLVKAGAFDTPEQEPRPDLRRDRGADAPFAGDARIARQQPEQPVRRRHRAAPAATAQGAGLGADGAAAAGILGDRLLSLVPSAGGLRARACSGWASRARPTCRRCCSAARRAASSSPAP